VKVFFTFTILLLLFFFFLFYFAELLIFTGSVYTAHSPLSFYVNSKFCAFTLFVVLDVVILCM